MDLLTGIFTAFGLSASAGLNAYIPLLLVGLLARYTDLINLSKPWDTLASPWIILMLCLLVIVEMVADKVPAVNHVNDLIQTLIRPAAGAIAFAASANWALRSASVSSAFLRSLMSTVMLMTPATAPFSSYKGVG